MDQNNLPTIKWFSKCVESQVPVDHANLLSIYLSSFEKNVAEKLGADRPNMTLEEVMNVLKDSALILAEPRRQNIQNLEMKKYELEESLKMIEKEITRVEELAEKRVSLYLYLIILLSVA